MSLNLDEFMLLFSNPLYKRLPAHLILLGIVGCLNFYQLNGNFVAFAGRLWSANGGSLSCMWNSFQGLVLMPIYCARVLTKFIGHIQNLYWLDIFFIACTKCSEVSLPKNRKKEKKCSKVLSSHLVVIYKTVALIRISYRKDGIDTLSHVEQQKSSF